MTLKSNATNKKQLKQILIFIYEDVANLNFHEIYTKHEVPNLISR